MDDIAGTPGTSSWLRAARRAWAEGDARALAALIASPPPNPGGPADYELLAWLAAGRGHHAWAFILMEAAAAAWAEVDGASAEAAAEASAALRAQLGPYEDDEALLSDVRRWAAARMDELRRADRRRPREGELSAEDDALVDLQAERVLELRHRWMFRLRASVAALEPGSPGLRLLQLGALLELDADDLILLTLLAAVERDEALQQLRRRWFNNDPHYTAGFAVRMLASSPDERVRLLSRLEIRAPLVRHRLLYLNTPEGRPYSPLASCLLDLDEAALAFIDGRPWWPPGIDNVAVLHAPGPRPGQSFYAPRLDKLHRAMELAGSARRGASVAICTPSLATTRLVAQAWSTGQGRPLLEIGAHWLFAEPTRFELVLRLLIREARLRGADILIDGERGWGEGGKGARECLRAIQRSAAFFDRALLFDAPREGDEHLQRGLDPLFQIRLGAPDLDEQVAVWREALLLHGVPPLSDAELRRKVCEMALNVEDVERAVRLAVDDAHLDASSPHDVAVTAEALRALASTHLNRGMFGVAERIQTGFSWGDVILPEDVLDALMAIISYARYQRRVFEDWGFGGKVPYGRANSSLFTGPPGTGKTMTAGIIAKELGMDLFRVEISSLVSKYVGETEKNLARVFDEAANGHAVILFDEADALFTKRTEVKSSNDRYSNLEVNYLLQKIETFEGVTVLTTNFPDNIDDAFARRIKFKVNFPFPDPTDRARLWEMMLPDAMPRDTIDFKRLGRAFELSGGNIKNAVLRAAFQAAEGEGLLNTAILETAGIAEAREMGKLIRVRDGRVVLD